MHPKRVLGALALAALIAFTVPLATAGQTAQEVAVIKPAPTELKWQQIPWVLDLAVGQAIARNERRPIFLWVTGDDPLERC